MTSYLGVALEVAMKSPGAVAGVLIDSGGFVIEKTSWMDGDLGSSGAVASQMLRQWAAIGTDLDIGPVQSILIERPGGLVTITPMTPDVALVVVGDHTSRPGRLRWQARRARTAMREGDRTLSEPEVIASPQPPEPVDELAAAIDEPAPAAPSRPAEGEIVLVGAHTFRLVTKLIERLVQLKWVRSSRLRAYSPSSTIVDVVLENGATLETIDRSRLEEFSIERAEQGGRRLVLRAGKSLAVPPTPIGTPG